MTTPEWLSRTELLIGEDKLRALRDKHILVVGLGGVGAYAAELICRAGIGRMTIVDGDKYQPSNVNRQLGALHTTMDKPKAEVVATRLLDINPNLQLEALNEFMREQRLIDLINQHAYDYVVDAIDTLSPKVYLISNCVKRGLKLISSMGSGGKLDPLNIRVDDISKSHTCKLAYKIRKYLRKLDVHKGFKVVYSPEMVDKKSVIAVEDEPNKKSTVGTISYMPPIFGCICASVAIRDLMECA